MSLGFKRLTSALDGKGGQRHALAALPPGKTWYPLYRRLGGPQERSERMRKISPPKWFDPRSIITNKTTVWIFWSGSLRFQRQFYVNAWAPRYERIWRLWSCITCARCRLEMEVRNRFRTSAAVSPLESSVPAKQNKNTQKRHYG